MSLPGWATRLATLYESHAANQFLLFGNVNDRFLIDGRLGSLYEFLTRAILPRFDVVLSYDLGNGVRIDKGGEIVTKWPGYKESPELPRAPSGDRVAHAFLPNDARTDSGRGDVIAQSGRSPRMPWRRRAECADRFASDLLRTSNHLGRKRQTAQLHRHLVPGGARMTE